MARRTYTRRTAKQPKPEVVAEPASFREELRVETRQELRAEDPRAAAARRAAEIFGRVDLDETEDDFRLPPGLAPDGWEYEWKRKTIAGAEDTMHQLHMSQMGWEPVPAARHPQLVPEGFRGAVERKGMILMQRPKEVNDAQRQRDYRRAVGQVQGNEERLSIAPSGQFDRANAKVKTSFEAPIPIPE